MRIIDFNLHEKINIPEEENVFWDECRLYDDTVIVTKSFSTLEKLNEYWRNTVHFVAGYIQDKINEYGFSDDIASDIYIIFLCAKDVPVEVSMEIESDKFCCKKYVLKAQQENNPWEVIENKMPLLFKWAPSSSDVFSSYGGNANYVREKLAEGNSTILSDILCSEENFIELPASDIIKRLVEWEDTDIGGVDVHE